MDALTNMTERSNILPCVSNRKCEGCNEVPRDSDVLHCFLCKKHFHVLNCSVVDTLDDALPSDTNLKNYIKFSAKSYPSGNFIWTCFRCGCLRELVSESNIDQRLAVIETAITTLVAPKASEQCASRAIDKVIADARSASSPAHNSSVIDLASDVESTHEDDDDYASNSHNDDTHYYPALDDMVASKTEKRKRPPTPTPPPRKSVTKYRVRVEGKKKTGVSLRSAIHRVLTAKKVSCQDIRFHSQDRADLLFESPGDAEIAYDHVNAALSDDAYLVRTPYPIKTKVIHIVGLTDEDTKQSVYNAISKPGRNLPIQHLLNPYSFQIRKLNPCKKNTSVFRATAVVSLEIFDLIDQKMKNKVKVDYLSCSVFLQRNIRCYKCQQLGHTSKTCRNDPACVNCGHSVSDCKNEPKCVNCALANLECGHRSDFKECPSYHSFSKESSKN